MSEAIVSIIMTFDTDKKTLYIQRKVNGTFEMVDLMRICIMGAKSLLEIAEEQDKSHLIGVMKKQEEHKDDER